MLYGFVIWLQQAPQLSHISNNVIDKPQNGISVRNCVTEMGTQWKVLLKLRLHYVDEVYTSLYPQ